MLSWWSILYINKQNSSPVILFSSVLYQNKILPKSFRVLKGTDWSSLSASGSSLSRHVFGMTRSMLAREPLQDWGWTLSGEVSMQSKTGNSTICSSCNKVCCFQTSFTTKENFRKKEEKCCNNVCTEFKPIDKSWKIGFSPALDRKLEAEGAVLWAGKKVVCRLIVLRSRSTLLSDDPTASGLEIVLISLVLHKNIDTVYGELINISLCKKILFNATYLISVAFIKYI